MTLEVHARRDGEPWVLSGLGLLPGHPRFLGDLPDLAGRLQADDRDPVWGGDVGSVETMPWAGSGRTPLVPVLGTELPTVWSAAHTRSGRTTLDLDGLSSPDTWALVDRRLVGQGVDTLVARAEDLRWRDAVRHEPRGIHALLGVDEVTVVAVPDAAQVGWRRAPAPPTAAPPPSGSVDVEVGCDHGDFDGCRRRARPLAPRWREPVETPERLRLSWTGVGAADEDGSGTTAYPVVEFVVEETVDPTGWAQARVVHRGPAEEAEVQVRAPLPRYYRVRATTTDDEGDLAGAWSEGLAVAASTGLDTVAVTDADHRPTCSSTCSVRCCGCAPRAATCWRCSRSPSTFGRTPSPVTSRRSPSLGARPGRPTGWPPSGRGRPPSSATARSTTRGWSTGRSSRGPRPRPRPASRTGRSPACSRHAPALAVPGSRRRTRCCTTRSRSSTTSRSRRGGPCAGCRSTRPSACAGTSRGCPRTPSPRIPTGVR